MPQIRLVIAILLTSLIASAAHAQPPAELPKPAKGTTADILKDIEEISKRQGAALKNAKVKVHRAFRYRDIDSEEVSIAVDVEFRGFTEDFDLDDVDILDADSGENYGSEPEVRPLQPDGLVNLDDGALENAEDFLRVALIYQIPKSTKNVKLEYWGQKLTPEAIKVTRGKLKYPDIPLIAGLEKWPFSSRMGAGAQTWQHGRWLIVRGWTDHDVSVIDLGSWSPKMQTLKWSVVKDIQPLKSGGYAVLSFNEFPDEKPAYSAWLHPKDRPGDSPLPKQGGRSAQDPEGLHGLAVLGERVFAYSERHLYELVGDKIVKVDDVPVAKGVVNKKLPKWGPEYSHGQIHLKNGQRLLLWDGDGYELVAGRLKKTWELDIDEDYEFQTVPWGDDGFYFLENRRVYRIRRGGKREEVMRGVENVMKINAGPDESILFRLGNNRHVADSGIWFPNDDTYSLIRTGEFGVIYGALNSDALHWSDVTKRFYAVENSQLFTFPAGSLLGRERLKLPALSRDDG